MEKLFWRLPWPCIAAVVVFAGLTRLPFGSWSVSAWFDLGAAMLAMSVLTIERHRMILASALRTEPARLATHGDA